MSVRLFYDNTLFDAAVLTPGSQQSTLPATNVQNPLRSRVWRTDILSAAETLVINFGSAVTPKAFIAFFTDVDDSVDSLIKIQGNASNSWGSPTFSQALTKKQILFTKKNYFFNYFSATETFQYFRYIFTKAAAAVTRDTGRIFLGNTYDIVRAPSRDGIEITFTDGSKKTKGVGLNTFVEVLPLYRLVKITFPPMSQTDITNLDTVFSSLGQNSNFYIQIDQVAPYDEIIYCKSLSYVKKLFAQKDSSNIWWTVTLNFEEML